MPLFEIKLHLSLLLTRQRNFEICIADQNRDFFSRLALYPFVIFMYKILNLNVVGSVTRFGDFLDFGQLFKAFGNN